MSKKSLGAKPFTFAEPIWMIATYDENGVPDIMNAAWCTPSDMKEVLLCLSADHKTVKNLLKTGAFTVSMADEEHITACDYLGIVSGNDVPDKVAKSGLSVTKSEKVNAPVINELPVCLECREKNFDTETEILTGEIVDIIAEEAVIRNGKVCCELAHPVTFDPYSMTYRAIGEPVADAFADGKKLIK